jgi:hypothetical protein
VTAVRIGIGVALLYKGTTGHVGDPGVAVALVGATANVQAGRKRVGEVAARVVVCPEAARTRLAVLDADTEAPVVVATPVAFPGHDVDGAGDRPRPGLGRRRAQDLDALDLFGRQGLQAESWRQALAVDQQLRETPAEAAHAWRTATTGPPGRRHAGQAAQHLAQGRIAEALDLLAADDDLGGRRLPSLVGIGLAAAGDLDLLRATRRLRCGRRSLRRSHRLRPGRGGKAGQRGSSGREHQGREAHRGPRCQSAQEHRRDFPRRSRCRSRLCFGSHGAATASLVTGTPFGPPAPCTPGPRAQPTRAAGLSPRPGSRAGWPPAAGVCTPGGVPPGSRPPRPARPPRRPS